jgi:ketosteroid isomerase-like protein
MMASRPNESKSAVAALIESYRQGFLRLDPELLGSIWDREHDPLVYVAMERPGPIYGWPAIKRYYEALPEHLEQMLAKSVDDVVIDVLGDAAAAFFQFHSKVKIRGREGQHKLVGRATMLFRHTPAGWRVIHFHESAPLTVPKPSSRSGADEK